MAIFFGGDLIYWYKSPEYLPLPWL